MVKVEPQRGAQFGDAAKGSGLAVGDCRGLEWAGPAATVVPIGFPGYLVALNVAVASILGPARKRTLGTSQDICLRGENEPIGTARDTIGKGSAFLVGGFHGVGFPFLRSGVESAVNVATGCIC
jgi:hypothetical protein